MLCTYWLAMNVLIRYDQIERQKQHRCQQAWFKQKRNTNPYINTCGFWIPYNEWLIVWNVLNLCVWKLVIYEQRMVLCDLFIFVCLKINKSSRHSIVAIWPNKARRCRINWTSLVLHHWFLWIYYLKRKHLPVGKYKNVFHLYGLVFYLFQNLHFFWSYHHRDQFNTSHGNNGRKSNEIIKRLNHFMNNSKRERERAEETMIEISK